MTEQLNNVPIQLTIRGAVPRGATSYALRRIEHVLAKEPGRVLDATVVMTLETNPAFERPARIEVGFDLDGTPVRVHVAAEGSAEAADLVADRLRRRLVQVRERARTRHRWVGRSHRAAEHSYRHGDLPSVAAAPADSAPLPSVSGVSRRSGAPVRV